MKDLRLHCMSVHNDTFDIRQFTVVLQSKIEVLVMKMTELDRENKFLDINQPEGLEHRDLLSHIVARYEAGHSG